MASIKDIGKTLNPFLHLVDEEGRKSNGPLRSRLASLSKGITGYFGSVEKFASYPEYTTQNLVTYTNDYGRGNAVVLDRHDITCGDKSVVNAFHLIRPSHDTIRYDYKCLSATDIGGQVSRTTPQNDEGGGHLIYLDRHDVNCGNEGAISRIHLQRLWNGSRWEYQYQYNCAKVPDMTNCVNKSTPTDGDGNGNIVVLDRHNVQCDPNQALTRFHLTRPTGSTISYEYTCCSR
jgi:hypothetical protein